MLYHHACIPREPQDVRDWRSVFFQDIPSWFWQEDSECGVPDLGFLKHNDIMDSLSSGAGNVISRFEQAPYPEKKEHGWHLVLLIRNALDRLRVIPSGWTHAIITARHVQRLCLELLGYITYLTDVVPCLNDARYSKESKALDTRGAFVVDKQTAQDFYRVGLPYWLIQRFTARLVVKNVVEVEPVSSRLSTTISWPRLSLAPGVVKDVIEMTWSMLTVQAASKFLCMPNLPALEPPASEVAIASTHALSRNDDGPPQKLQKIMTSDPVVATGSQAPRQSTHRGRRAPKQKHVFRPLNLQPHLVHVSYPLFYPDIPVAWVDALRAVSPLPIPAARGAVYYFPPPLIFVSGIDEKLAQYMHNYIRIRAFCRQRVLDQSTNALPLKISEWRIALYRHYSATSSDTAQNSEFLYLTLIDINKCHALDIVQEEDANQRASRRMAISRLFGSTNGPGSYASGVTVSWGHRMVTLDDIKSDVNLQREVLWEMFELNFRTELRALDTYLTHSDTWAIMLMWQRQELMARVWGATSGAFSVVPEWERSLPLDNWQPVQDLQMEDLGNEVFVSRGSRLKAFLNVLSRWEGFPDTLHTFVSRTAAFTSTAVFQKVEHDAVDFYVRTFVRVYHRLPTPPPHVPTSMLQV